jgi:hypothetical protein
MQVNSAQDYTTLLKRRIVATSIVQDPPPAHRRYNYVYISVLANEATTRNRFVVPLFPYGASYSSTCCVLPTRGTLPGSLV